MSFADALAGPAPSAFVAGLERGASRRSRQSAKNPHAAALGRLGGVKGGLARAARLSAAERRAIARKAARARWARASSAR